MISQSGLFCFPAATNALDGRRSASTKPHTSQTKAASARSPRGEERALIVPVFRTTTSGSRRRAGTGTKGPLPPGLGQLAHGWSALLARDLAGQGGLPVEYPGAVLGEPVVLLDRLGPRGRHVLGGPGGQGRQRAVAAPPGDPGGQLTQGLGGQDPGPGGGLHRLGARQLAHLGLPVKGASIHAHTSFLGRPSGRPAESGGLPASLVPSGSAAARGSSSSWSSPAPSGLVACFQAPRAG